MNKWLLILSCISCLFSLGKAAENYADTAKGKAFIAQLSGHYGYTENELIQLLQQVSRDEKILKKIARPAEKAIPWYRYQKIFLDTKRVNNGVKFYHQHEKVLQEAYQKYGVSPSIIVAILGVETRYGKVMGNDKVITALATIGFDYPKREAFFTKELREFLRLSKENHFDPLALKGSYAGAMGMAQFMPSSYRHYAVDYENDGKIDLWTNPNDAIFSIANYLAKNGWQRDQLIVDEAELLLPYSGKYQHKPFTTLAAVKSQGMMLKNLVAVDSVPVGVLSLEGEERELVFVTFKNFAVITTYNTSPMYAMAVHDLAAVIEEKLR